MFNRSEIMKTAWHSYKIARWGRWTGGNNTLFLRDLFTQALRDTWAEAKKQAAWDAESARQQARDEKERQAAIARFANWSPAERTSRIEVLKEELRCLPYTDAPIAQRQATLQTETAQLSA